MPEKNYNDLKRDYDALTRICQDESTKRAILEAENKVLRQLVTDSTETLRIISERTAASVKRARGFPTNPARRAK